MKIGDRVRITAPSHVLGHPSSRTGEIIKPVKHTLNGYYRVKLDQPYKLRTMHIDACNFPSEHLEVLP